MFGRARENVVTRSRCHKSSSPFLQERFVSSLYQVTITTVVVFGILSVAVSPWESSNVSPVVHVGARLTKGQIHDKPSLYASHALSFRAEEGLEQGDIRKW